MPSEVRQTSPWRVSQPISKLSVLQNPLFSRKSRHLRPVNPAVKTAVWQLPKGLREPDALVSFNSVAPGGLDLLVDAVQSCFPAGTPADAGSLLTNARQESAVRRSLEAVRRALSALDSGLTPDAVLTDAEEALESIGELTGRTAKEEIVGAVFSRFCVGK